MSEESILVQRANAFLGALESLLKRMKEGDPAARGTIAKLKRGIGKEPGSCIEMFPFIIPKIDGINSEKEQRVFFMIAALFAVHQNPEYNSDEKESRSNFGDTFSSISAKSDSDSIEKRFVALLNSHYDELFSHLKHAVSLAKSKEVSINFKSLFWDIIQWDNPEQKTQKKWAKSFWYKEKMEDKEKSKTKDKTKNKKNKKSEEEL